VCHNVINVQDTTMTLQNAVDDIVILRTVQRLLPEFPALPVYKLYTLLIFTQNSPFLQNMANTKNTKSVM